MLITASGVGPTLALKILSGMSVDELVPAIRKGDLAQLTRIPGVGKKTAERIVVELRDKMAAMEAVKILGQQRVCDLPCAVGAEVHEDHDIAVGHAHRLAAVFVVVEAHQRSVGVGHGPARARIDVTPGFSRQADSTLAP